MEKIGTNDEEDAIECTNLPVEVLVVENEPEEQNSENFPARHVPARLFVPWKLELNILHDIIKRGKTFNQTMYIDYVNECNRKGIPDRTYIFRSKAFLI